MPGRPGILARLTGRYALLVVGLWVLTAAAANVAVPQLERVVDSHARSFMPPGAPSAVAAARAAQLFDQAPSNNFVYVVLERNQRLGAGDRQFYNALTAALGSDHRNVYAATDLWSQPATAAGAQSTGGQAVSMMVRLAGMLGTAQARDSVNAVRATAQKLGPPAGLQVHVTGPSATIVDEFSAIDRQMLGITAATIGLILLLLLVVYRSPVAATIPLISVGLALALARAVVAALGQANVVEVSLFSVALMAAMALGAGTDYAIFLVGRYHEARRGGVAAAQALTMAYRSIAPVVIGSALTVSVALACLVFAHVGSFRSAGLPCAIGILATMVAALKLTPALMSLAVRRGYLEPRPSRTAQRWRRVGTTVARWPGPILVAALGLTLLDALPLAGMRIGFNEPAATPLSTGSNRGYASAGRHFPENALLPDVIAIRADHDLRNTAGLIAIERITQRIMAVPGVRAVQSASRPDGKVPEQATLSYQAGVLGRQFGDTVDSLTQRLARVSELDGALAQTQHAVDGLGNGLRGGSAGLADMSGRGRRHAGRDGRPAAQRHHGVGLPRPAAQLRRADPRLCRQPDLLDGGPGADAGRQPGANVGATRLRSRQTDHRLQHRRHRDGRAAAERRRDENALAQSRSVMRDLLGLSDTLGPQMRQLTDYLNEIGTQFQGSAAADFYLPQRALTDPRYTAVLNHLIS